MTATTSKATWQDMASKLQKMGGVAKVVLGEPKGIQATGVVAIMPERGYIDGTTLQGPREIHEVTLRRYANVMQGDEEKHELALDDWRAQILEDVFGDFDLGGNIAYALPPETRWEYGYQEIGGQMFRLLDITIAYRVDDRATFVA